MQTPKDRYGWARVLFFTLIIPFTVNMFAEAMDRSQGVLESVDHKRADLAIGAPIGFAVAEAVAVIIGFSMAHWLRNGNDWRLLFAISADFWIIAFCCARDALTHLCEGDIPHPPHHASIL